MMSGKDRPMCSSVVPNAGPDGVTGLVPQAEIHAIADILQTCVHCSGLANVGTSTASFTSPTGPTASTGATSTLTSTNSADLVYGNLAISLGGNAATSFLVSPERIASLATLINSTSSMSGSFFAPTMPTATVGSSTTLTFASPSGVTASPTCPLLSIGKPGVLPQ